MLDMDLGLNEKRDDLDKETRDGIQDPGTSGK